jgi:hypothetical protein
MDSTASTPTVTFLNHGITGGGCSIHETTTTLAVMYEGSVTTVAQVKAAINASTYWRAFGGTAATVLDTTSTDECVNVAVSGSTLNAWLSTDSATALVCKANAGTATFANCKAVIDACGSGLVAVTSAASGTVASVLSATALTGGVTAVALDSTQVKGEGFSVARSGASGTGEYTVTLDRGWLNAQLLQFNGAIQLPTKESVYPTAAARLDLYSDSGQTLKITTYNPRTPAVVDVKPADGRALLFTAKFIVNR